jgi:anti-sigma B factor antagonist
MTEAADVNLHARDLLSTTVTTRRDAVVIVLVGELDLYTARRLKGTVDTVLADGGSRLVIDVARLSFCDAAGLGALLWCRRRIADRGGWLRLASVSPRMAELLRLTKLSNALPVHSAAAGAPAAISATRAAPGGA